MDTPHNYSRREAGAVRPCLYGPVGLPEFVSHTFAAVEIDRHESGLTSFQLEKQIGDSMVVIDTGEWPAGVAPLTGAADVCIEEVDGVHRHVL